MRELDSAKNGRMWARFAAFAILCALIAAFGGLTVIRNGSHPDSGTVAAQLSASRPTARLEYDLSTDAKGRLKLRVMTNAREVRLQYLQAGTKKSKGQARLTYVRKWRTLPVSAGVAKTTLPALSQNIAIKARATKSLQASYWLAVSSAQYGNSPPLGLEQVKWPDTIQGYHALLNQTSKELVGFTLTYSEVRDETGVSMEYSWWGESGLEIHADYKDEEDGGKTGLFAIGGYLAWAGCGEPSGVSPEIAGWLQATSGDEFWERVQASEASQTPGQLDWVLCPSVYSVDAGEMMPTQFWTYMASWTDGDWTIVVDADDERSRVTAIKALVAAAKALAQTGAPAGVG